MALLTFYVNMSASVSAASRHIVLSIVVQRNLVSLTSFIIACKSTLMVLSWFQWFSCMYAFMENVRRRRIFSCGSSMAYHDRTGYAMPFTAGAARKGLWPANIDANLQPYYRRQSSNPRREPRRIYQNYAFEIFVETVVSWNIDEIRTYSVISTPPSRSLCSIHSKLR